MLITLGALLNPQIVYANDGGAVGKTYHHVLPILPGLLSILIGPLLVAVIPIELSCFLS